MTRAELKAKAKASLKGKYGQTIKMMLQFLLISIVISFVVGFVSGLLGLGEDISSVLIDIVSLVITGLLIFGYNSYFLKLSRDEEVNASELYSKKDMFKLYITISVLVFIKTFLWSLLFIIPGIIVAIGYSFVYYVALDNPELSTKEILAKSKDMLNGHKLDLVVLELSFLGWAILGVFTFGILYLWLTPYMTVTIANFYNMLKEESSQV